MAAPIATAELPVFSSPQPVLPTFEYAITLHRPWPYAIAHLGKDVENRKSNLRCVKPGEYIAIHAGRSYSFEAEELLIEEFPNVPFPEITEHPTGIVAIAEFLGNITKSDSMWFTGPVGWQLGKIHKLIDAVPCSGQQGVWKPSKEIRDAVHKELKVPF